MTMSGQGPLLLAVNWSFRPIGDIRGIELTAPKRLFVYRPRPPKVQLAGD